MITISKLLPWRHIVPKPLLLNRGHDLIERLKCHKVVSAGLTATNKKEQHANGSHVFTIFHIDLYMNMQKNKPGETSDSKKIYAKIPPTVRVE